MGLLFGAVQPWIVSLYAVLMILAFVVLLWQGRLLWRPGPWVWGTVGVFLAVTLFQMIPLPAEGLAWLSPVRGRTPAKTAGIWYRHAHNDYLQLVTEAGWAGAVPLVIGFFFFLFRGIRRAVRVGFDVGRFRLFVAIGSLAGLCSMAFHGFLDFNFQIPANQVFFVLLLALVEAGIFRSDEHRTPAAMASRKMVV